MSRFVQVVSESDAIVVSIPLKLRKRASQGRKLMVAGGDKAAPPVARHEHATILKALGRAYRWKRMLESGEFASITDLATAERINHSYVRRILRLTLLSPEITERLLDSRMLRGIRVQHLTEIFSDDWEVQRRHTSRLSTAAIEWRAGVSEQAEGVRLSRGYLPFSDNPVTVKF